MVARLQMIIQDVVPVVDLGRIYSLIGELPAVNTRARLEAAAAATDVLDCERATVFLCDHAKGELFSRIATGMEGAPIQEINVVRKHLSSELGFSKEHRDINIRRIGYVASEITKNGGIAICAPIAPYTATRRAVREMIEAYGAFIEVHVATSIEECERRDRKGLYKLAREGKIKEFTGISDPYEAPTKAELVVNTEGAEVDYCAQQVILKLESMGLIKG